jgi:hypothetical protein
MLERNAYRKHRHFGVPPIAAMSERETRKGFVSEKLGRSIRA